MSGYKLVETDVFNSDDVALCMDPSDTLYLSAHVYCLRPGVADMTELSDLFSGDKKCEIIPILDGEMIKRDGKVYQVTKIPVSLIYSGKITSEEYDKKELVFPYSRKQA